MIILKYDHIFVRDGEKEIYSQIDIHAPEKSPLGDYNCAVEFDGFGHKFSKKIIGISKPQVIVLAIAFVNLLILESKEFKLDLIYCKLADGSTELLVPEMIGERMQD